MTEQAVDVEFNIAGAKIAALEWRKAAPIKVLALHGWLDNAASFNRLAPLLPGTHIVALDMPGHGLSDHKPPQATYNLWDDLRDVFAAADALGWDEFHLLGHSRGAMMSFLIGAACADRIKSMSLLDGCWPMPEKIEDAPKILGKFVKQNAYDQQHRFPSYATFEDALQPRINGNLPMTAESTAIILARGSYLGEDGRYHLRGDPRLKTGSAFKLSNEHNQAFLDNQQVPTLLIYASEGVGKYRNYFESIEKSDKITIEELSGGHHFHLDGPVFKIAELVNKHILENN